MTVSLENAEAKLQGNGSTVTFPLGMEVHDASTIEASKWTGSTRVNLVLDIDFTVTDLDNELGATLTYPISGSPMSNGEFIYVKRRTPQIQSTTGNIVNELDPVAIEERFDRLTMMIQELEGKLARALTMSTDQVADFVPTPNGFFGTNSAGLPVIVGGISTSLEVISGIVVWEGATVASLENDTDLAYGSGTVAVSVGDIVRAGGYRYQVVAGNAGTYDLQTAGAVRLVALDIELGAYASTINASKATAFINAAITAGKGLITAGTRTLSSVSISALSSLSLVGSAKSIWKRAVGAVNLLTFNSPVNLFIQDLTLNGDWSNLGTNGHGLVMIDAQKSTVINYTADDFGGLDVTNGGAALLLYPADGSSLLQKNIVAMARMSGPTASEKSFGLIAASSQLSVVGLNIVSDFTNYGLEFKNNSYHNVMGMCTGSFSRYSFGLGFEGSYYNEYNVFGLLASKDSDVALQFAHAKHNVAVGLAAHSDAPPNTFANGHSYGLHIETGSDENIGLGILTTGSAMTHPLRIRGSRNAVSIADYSAADAAVTINNGAQENYVELLHIGNKAETIKSLIDDQNSPIIVKGPGANIIDSPVTREYFGSITDAFTWGLDGLGQSYNHYSTTSFRFEGYNGQSILGLGVKVNMQSGIRIVTQTDPDEACLVYQKHVTLPYWRLDVEKTQVLRIEKTNFLPVSHNGIALGKNDQAWGDAFVKNLRFTPDTVSVPLENGSVTAIRVSNTQIALKFKGTDGTTRTCNLTFA